MTDKTELPGYTQEYSKKSENPFIKLEFKGDKELADHPLVEQVRLILDLVTVYKIWQMRISDYYDARKNVLFDLPTSSETKRNFFNYLVAEADNLDILTHEFSNYIKIKQQGVEDLQLRQELDEMMIGYIGKNYKDVWLGMGEEKVEIKEVMDLTVLVDTSSNIAHDLKTPLTVQKGMAQFLLKNNSPRMVDNFIEAMAGMDQRMDSIIEQIKNKYVKEAFDITYLYEIVKGILQRESLGREDGLSIGFHIGEIEGLSKDEYVVWWRYMIGKILTNISTNALNVLSEPGVDKQGKNISLSMVRVEVDGKPYIKLVVEDNIKGFNLELAKAGRYLPGVGGYENQETRSTRVGMSSNQAKTEQKYDIKLKIYNRYDTSKMTQSEIMELERDPFLRDEAGEKIGFKRNPIGAVHEFLLPIKSRADVERMQSEDEINLI